MDSPDASYLAQFSDDAVPALTGIVDHLPDAERQVVDGRLSSLGRQRYRHPEWRRWQSFHLALERVSLAGGSLRCANLIYRGGAQ